MIFFECSNCGRQHSLEEFNESHFCRQCGRLLSYKDRRLVEQDAKKEAKIVTPNAKAQVKKDTGLLVKNKKVTSGSNDSAKNSGNVWWVNPQSPPCESMSKACKKRELVVETMKSKDGLDNCPHLRECRQKSEAK